MPPSTFRVYKTRTGTARTPSTKRPPQSQASGGQAALTTPRSPRSPRPGSGLLVLAHSDGKLDRRGLLLFLSFSGSLFARHSRDINLSNASNQRDFTLQDVIISGIVLVYERPSRCC